MKISLSKLKTNKKIVYSLLLLLIALYFLTGCESIPPGIPPTGPIVSIDTTTGKPLSPVDAINSMTTAIATCPKIYANEFAPIVKLYPIKISSSDKEYKLELNFLTARLYRNLIGMDIINMPSISKNNVYIDFRLSSSFSRVINEYDEEEEVKDQALIFDWKIKLQSQQDNFFKTVWEENIEVILDTK